MPELSLNAKPRKEKGNGPNRRLRAEGLIPAVIYGGEKEPESLTLNVREIERVLHSGLSHPLIDLKVEGVEATEKVMVREMQRHPVNNRPVHADLIRIQEGHMIHMTIEVAGIGQPVGVREGGLLERSIREVEIRCLPQHLPNKFEVDISGMAMNSSIKAGDLPLGEHIHLLTEPDTVLFHVAPLKAEVAPTPVEGEGEPAQPEVIGRKKEAEEEEKKA